LGGDAVCCEAKLSLNFIALRKIDNALKDSSSVAAITSTRS
jgi:hypothetical protein